MSAEVINELIFWFSCFVTGIVITLIYDAIRIFRRVIRHNSFWTSIEDILFWIFAAITIFLLLYQMNNGTVRWFAVLGLAVGMWIYKKIFGDILVNFMSTIITKILHIVVRVILAPLRLVKRPVIKLLRALKSSSLRAKKKLTGNIKKVKIDLCKHNKRSETGNLNESKKVSE